MVVVFMTRFELEIELNYYADEKKARQEGGKSRRVRMRRLGEG